ncbi:3-ketoacyl-ACP reductase [Bradyrhizobium genomosp. I (2014)]|uniref:3-ketoacyl-ACP reductase n=1 Tax=Bradyrhizobium genomosp. I (2014) TaxID=2683269 RepID=UPI0004B76172|nr:3-ketoacyl-ACP reductase [Bradyrhizobium sp. CCBAU 43298]
MNNPGRRSALVTGAGRGIGRGIALALSDAGFAVVANDLPGSTDLAETVAAIRQKGGEAKALPFDVSNVADHQRAVDEAWNAFGGIDCLVNNAGVSVGVRDDLLKATPESYDRVMSINLRGPFFLTQEVARRMVGAESSLFRSIITISSINAEFASVDRGEYCISKTGLSMLAQLFAVRLAAHRIGSYEIRPGIIRTQMTAVATEKYDRLIAEGLTAFQRWGEPEDIGRATAMLATGQLQYSTGEVIRVDGGLALRSL